MLAKEPAGHEAQVVELSRYVPGTQGRQMAWPSRVWCRPARHSVHVCESSSAPRAHPCGHAVHGIDKLDLNLPAAQAVLARCEEWCGTRVHTPDALFMSLLAALGEAQTLGVILSSDHRISMQFAVLMRVLHELARVYECRAKLLANLAEPFPALV